MVRALLRDVDPKTQTRRILKMPTQYAFREMRDGRAIFDLAEKPPLIPNPYPPSNGRMKRIRALWLPSCGADCPYGKPGDRLWVKETFAIGASQPYADGQEDEVAIYRATGADDHFPPKWKPSIFMPRWASRITLEIESVRVERLNEISHADALAEGTPMPALGPTEGQNLTTAQHAYAALWESINGKGSWALNPWVWCIAFRKL